MIRAGVALIACLCLTSPAVGQTRTVKSSVGQAGTRQSGSDSVRGRTPMTRIDNRLQTRIDTRLDRRIDADNAGSNDLLGSFQTATKNTQQPLKPTAGPSGSQ